MLLIDEPESSFDNLFLNSEVNQLIRDISKEMPVVVVTHNNTIGASIKPNYLLYTAKTIEDKTVKYKVYSGYPTDIELSTVEGERVNTYEVTLGCLEAGIDAYDERRMGYANLKNR